MLEEKPVLLLDVDGVLNLFGGKAPVWYSRPVTHKVVNGYPINFPRDIPEILDRLAEHFEIIWYTMWNERAPLDFAPAFGLPRFRHLECDWDFGAMLSRAYPEFRLWTPKTPLIPEYLAGRPFVWVDDDTTADDERWLREHPEVGDFLLITPSPREGLTHADVDRAIRWAEGRRAVAA